MHSTLPSWIVRTETITEAVVCRRVGLLLQPSHQPFDRITAPIIAEQHKIFREAFFIGGDGLVAWVIENVIPADALFCAEYAFNVRYCFGP